MINMVLKILQTMTIVAEKTAGTEKQNGIVPSLSVEGFNVLVD
jgi:hypothetical protein